MAELSNKVTLLISCRHCGKKVKVRIFPEDIEKYKNGELVQRVFPYLTAEERELFISGICPECWDEMFKDQDE